MKELTGAILWDLVDFFVGALRIQVCPKDRITPIESYDLGMGLDLKPTLGRGLDSLRWIFLED